MTDERGPDLTQKLLSEMRTQLEEARRERDEARRERDYDHARVEELAAIIANMKSKRKMLPAVAQSLSEMRTQLEEARRDRDKAEAVVKDVESVLKSLIEWMHGLPDNVPGVCRHEEMTRNLAQIVVANRSRIQRRRP